ncbi:uncharacterized protein [Temnothorax nylanderi]|uniref:uncharacterized protein n=1 Tax=Temnothorax nylanderi TaxID=102681 RepID=UPI003A844BD0
MSKEVQGTGKKKTARELKGRERADSLSILDYVRGGDKEKEHNKRKREERERMADEIFKKSNMMDRTPPGLKQTGEEREIKNEEGTLMGMLRELKIEMVGLRNEIKEIKENWELRVDRMEKKLVEMEERMKEMERRRGETGVAKGENIEEIVEKVAELVKQNKGKVESREGKREAKDEIGQKVRRLKRIIEEKEKRERRNKIVIRGLNTNTKTRSIKDVAREFLEHEFKVKEEVKSVQTVGMEGREVVIIELEDWEIKEKIMKEKKKLKDKSVGRIYIDHNMTKTEREVQRKIRERARIKKEDGKIVKVGYKKMNIGGKQYVWSEEAGELREKKNF